MLPPYDELAARLQDREAELATAKAEIAWLKRQLFGPGKSEKQDRLQGTLPLEGVVAEPAVAKVQTVSYERLAAPKEQRPVPAEAFKNVPVKETIVLEPVEVQAAPEDWERIGEERTFEIDVVAPQVFKREIVRPKYRHKTNRALPPVVAPGAGAGSDGRLRLGGAARLGRPLEIRGSRPALPLGKAVGPLGRGHPTADDGRLDPDPGGVAGANLPGDAPAAVGRSVSAGRRNAGALQRPG